MHYLDYNEKTTHGTQDFPLAFYRVDQEHPRYEMPFHWHKETEIIRIVKGNLTLYLNEENFHAKAGDILWVNQGILHGGTPTECVYECLVFDASALLMPGICHRYISLLTGKKTTIRPFFSAEMTAVQTLTNRLFENAQKECPGSELTTLGTLLELLGMIYEKQYYTAQTDNSLPDPDRIHVLKPVLEYIDQSYMHPITLDELAKLAGMSPRYFCRFFDAYIHRTPIDYLNYYRIERACYFLSTSSDSITELAYRCGFNDSSYFVKIFKKYKGITPKQYQKLFS
ncbi:MAG: AraC family transcriptional regulator [Lachnospiraceae bacterium]|nr:AraC family transcriptional regulator [Lachnospiraceae bacterium]